MRETKYLEQQFLENSSQNQNKPDFWTFQFLKMFQRKVWTGLNKLIVKILITFRWDTVLTTHSPLLLHSVSNTLLDLKGTTYLQAICAKLSMAAEWTSVCLGQVQIIHFFVLRSRERSGKSFCFLKPSTSPASGNGFEPHLQLENRPKSHHQAWKAIISWFPRAIAQFEVQGPAYEHLQSRVVL